MSVPSDSSLPEPQSGSDETVRSIGPRWATSATASATVVGALDAEFSAVVDNTGLVSPVEAAWSLDWWIGADDRWYYPSEEPTVRQRRLGSGPVIETSMRIPSGDAVATVYGSRSAAENGVATDVVVVEVANRSPVPVAVVMAIRPYPAANPSTTGLAGESSPDSQPSSIDIKEIDSTTIVVNGLNLLLPRPAGGSISSADDDIVGTIEHGSELSGLIPVSGPTGTAAVMFPLPHATTLRFVLAERTVEVDRLPEAEQVSRGWVSVIDGDARFSTPDDGVDILLGAARARLLTGAAEALDEVDHVRTAGSTSGATSAWSRWRGRAVDHSSSCDSGAGDIALAMAASGYWDSLDGLLTHLGDGHPMGCSSAEAGGRLIAGVSLATSLWLAHDHDRALVSAHRILESLTNLTTRVDRLSSRPGNRPGPGSGDEPRDSPRQRALAGLGLLCQAIGQHDASDELRSRLGDWDLESDPALAVGGPPDLARLVKLGQLANEAGSWPNPDQGCAVPAMTASVDSVAGAARYLNAARSMLVAEGLAGTIELLPGFATAWRGGALEVHNAPTLFGRLSFAVRWHGPRPALLWNMDRSESALKPTSGERQISLRCRSLDPVWSSTEASGETLLAGSPDGLGEAPSPGDSFS